MWSTLVLSYCKENKLTHFPIVDMMSSDLFHNKKISRQVSTELARAIIDHMVTHGTAKWEGKDKLRATIILRTLQGWADLIYKWAERMGNLNTVTTVFEILDGDDTTEEEFHGMDRDLFHRTMALLEKDGKAKLFDVGGAGEGVKFVSQ